MRAADVRIDTFVWTLAAIVVGAAGLRLWGLDHGLPFVFNADENAHFVPRAIGMFDHSYNPSYFINPPAFTYLLHVVFWAIWGGEGVQEAFAADVGDVYVVARAAAAVLGTLTVGLLAWAAARFLDRRTALLAAALFAAAFLPVHYSHLALNDVPTLAPLAFALVGIAGVLRRGRLLDFAIAGVGIGLACATKYTAGIVVLCLLAAAVLAPGGRARAIGGLALSGVLALAMFALANPYAIIDFDSFRDGLDEQATASNDGGGKLGLRGDNGIVYYIGTLGWGLGAVPAVAAFGGAIWMFFRDRALAIVLVPAPILFVLFMGSQDRFFARWMLPIYPILCLLAAWTAMQVADELLERWESRGRRNPALLPGAGRRVAIATWLAALLLVGHGLVLSVHNDTVLASEDTRALTRAWMVQNIPEGSKVVVEPIAPDQWAMDPGRPSRKTGNGNRWIKWRTSRSKVNNDGTIRRGIGRRVKLEDYERTTRPQLVDSYARGGFCWVVTGSTQFGRAYADPSQVPQAIRYYDELRRRGRVVFRASPYDDPDDTRPFSFDDSFNYRPLAYERPGPEVIVYRLRGGDC